MQLLDIFSVVKQYNTVYIIKGSILTILLTAFCETTFKRSTNTQRLITMIIVFSQDDNLRGLTIL